MKVTWKDVETKAYSEYYVSKDEYTFQVEEIKTNTVFLRGINNSIYQWIAKTIYYAQFTPHLYSAPLAYASSNGTGLFTGGVNSIEQPKLKCECGAHKVNSNIHSDWCNIYKESV